MTLLPEIPLPLAETAAGALEFPQLRNHIASLCVSPLGHAFTLTLAPSASLPWIDTQQQRTSELRAFLAAGGSFDFHGLFDPTTLLDQARLEGSALESLTVNQVLALAERIAAWRTLLTPAPGVTPRNWPATHNLSAPLLPHDLAPLLRTLRGKIEPDGSLADDASPELHRIRRALERQHRAIQESLRKSLARLVAEGSTQEDLITVRGERFVIPVKSEFRRRVPGVIHGSSSSGQTVFVEPLDTIEHNNELVRLLDEEQSEIHRILVALTRAIGQQAEPILLGTAILAELESHFARARFANSLQCTRPTFAATDSSSTNSRTTDESTTDKSTADKSTTNENNTDKSTTDESTADKSTTNENNTDESGKNESTTDEIVILSGAKDLLLSSSPKPGLHLQNARHPLLELRLQREGSTTVPLTLALTPQARQLIISGPNTGGKTVALKTTGLISLMAQAGLPVPAESATLPLFTSVFADIGDAQSIERNLSSFSAHVLNLDRIARTADCNSLVLLDELGSATDPEEGAALAVAIAQNFLTLHSWTCITTHLTSLKVYAASRPGVLNAAVGFDQATLSPTYQLRLGVPGASAGLNIAERLGLSVQIVAAARDQLTTQAIDIAALLDSLHARLAAAHAERDQLKLRETELTRERLRLETEGRAEQKARTKELEGKLNSLIADFEYQLREIVKAIEDKALAQKIQRDSATRIARAKREFSDQFKSTVVAHTTGADRNDPAAQPHLPKSVRVGDLVKLKSLGRQARVDRLIDAKNFEVSVGTMKMRVPLADIAEVTPVVAVTPLEAARRRGGVTIQTSGNPDYLPSEINVIGRTADEAEDEVSRFLDQAFLAGLPRIRIVHGTGMGILRRTLREFLRNHPHVATVTEPPHNQGGQGATEVELRQ